MLIKVLSVNVQGLVCYFLEILIVNGGIKWSHFRLQRNFIQLPSPELASELQCPGHLIHLVLFFLDFSASVLSKKHTLSVADLSPLGFLRCLVVQNVS